MKKIIVIMIVFFISLNVYAIDACSTSELSRLNELANNVTFKSNYNIIEDDEVEEINVIYNIEISNYSDDLKISYKTTYDDEIIEVDPKVGLDADFSPTDNVTFYIRAYTDNMCTTKLLKTVTVKLPEYNEYYYYHKDKCDNNSDFKYCKEFMDVDISDEEIEKLFDEYLKKDDIINVPEVVKNNKAIIFGCIYGVVVIGIVAVILIVLEKNKKKKKDDL